MCSDKLSCALCRESFVKDNIVINEETQSRIFNNSITNN